MKLSCGVVAEKVEGLLTLFVRCGETCLPQSMKVPTAPAPAKDAPAPAMDVPAPAIDAPAMDAPPLCCRRRDN